jgi:HlyD family secretion protein
VRLQDRPLLEGVERDPNDESSDSATARRSAADKAETRRNRNRRHVWVAEGDALRAIEVVTGISDTKFSVLVSGDLKEGQKLVTGIQPAE